MSFRRLRGCGEGRIFISFLVRGLIFFFKVFIRKWVVVVLGSNFVVFFGLLVLDGRIIFWFYVK